jgi:hypothetical protein
MQLVRAPGEVDALSYQTADGGDPAAVDFVRILTRIGHNRTARIAAGLDGFATEREADLLMMLALEGAEARAVAERLEVEQDRVAE